MTAPWWGEALALPAIALPRTAPITIVGGGILGLSTAWWLASAGARPLLLERQGAGAGASGRNGGFLPLGTAEDYDASVARLGRSRARELLGLTLENRRLAEELLSDAAIACDFRPVGHLHLALDDAEHDVNRQLAALLTEDGCATDHLDRPSAQAMVATPFGEQIRGGMFFRDIALLHSGKLMRGLADAATRLGARLARTTVQRCEWRNGSVELATDRGVLSTGAVLIATNAWTGEVFPGLRQLVTPVRGQVLALAPTAPNFRTGMTAMTTATEEYWQQMPDGSILLGGCRAVRPDRDEGVLDLAPTDDVQSALEGVLPKLFPGIGPLTVTHRWAGTMGFTPDRLPIVAPLPQGSGWAAGGFSGHGMSLALVFGRLLADGLLGRPLDPRLSLFAPDRFGEMMS